MKTKGRKSDGIVKKCMKSMESGMQMAYGTKNASALYWQKYRKTVIKVVKNLKTGKNSQVRKSGKKEFMYCGKDA